MREEDDMERGLLSEVPKSPDGQNSTQNFLSLTTRIRLQLSVTYFFAQADQLLDSNVLRDLIQDELYVSALILYTIVLLPQLVIWFFLFMHDMASSYSLLRIILLPLISAAATIAVLCQSSTPHTESILNVTVRCACISLEPLYELVIGWQANKVSENMLWHSIAEGLLEGASSGTYTLYMLLLRGGKPKWSFLASIGGSFLSVTKAAGSLNFYGRETVDIWEQAKFALAMLPRVISRVVTLAFIAYLTRVGDDLHQNRGYIILAFLLFEVCNNALILRDKNENTPYSVTALFSFSMVFVGPPGFLGTLDRIRWSHSLRQFVLMIPMTAVALTISPLGSEHMHMLITEYRFFLLLWVVTLPWTLIGMYCTRFQGTVALSVQEENATHQLVTAMMQNDVILQDLLVNVEGADEERAKQWHTEQQVAIKERRKGERIIEFLDTSNLTSPKATPGDIIVLDGGTKYFKAGFAGETEPRSIFPTVFGTAYGESKGSTKGMRNGVYIGQDAVSCEEPLEIRYVIRSSIVTEWNEMENIWRHAFFNCLKVNPKEHPVLLTERVLNPKANVERMVQIMFEAFSCPAVFLAYQSVLSMYASGGVTGIVVEVGAGATSYVPIIHGWPITHAINKEDIGGEAVSFFFNKLLTERGYSFVSAKEQLESADAMEKLGLISQDYERDLKIAAESASLERTYELRNGDVITVGSERFRAPELLFDPRPQFQAKYAGIHKSTFQCISQCHEGIRPELLKNIVLCGGVTKLPGFEDRMNVELNLLFDSDATAKTADQKLKCKTLSNGSISAWVGGSTMAAWFYEYKNQFLTAEQYDESGPSIAHNCFQLQ